MTETDEELFLVDIRGGSALFRPEDNRVELGISLHDWAENGRPFQLLMRQGDDDDGVWLMAVPREDER